MDDTIIRLMQLAPYRAIIKVHRTHLEDGKHYVTLAKDDFDNIVRHFLRLIPFDDEEYLKSSTSLAEGIMLGRHHISASQHFVRHGYFEGRRPIPEYFPEDYSFELALLERPRAYYEAMYRAGRDVDRV